MQTCGTFHLKPNFTAEGRVWEKANKYRFYLCHNWQLKPAKSIICQNQYGYEERECIINKAGDEEKVFWAMLEQ